MKLPGCVKGYSASAADFSPARTALTFRSPASRYDASLCRYIYTLSARRLKSGQHVLRRYAGTERAFLYAVESEAKEVHRNRGRTRPPTFLPGAFARTHPETLLSAIKAQAR